ncbi:uncharacterized protein [Rutidosis leptorrhynchoides]|uniref:uncharacterized protein n=1 Tax=Rutidosis leptorrhynchoides TaxID=125765 RepID=UPI003A98E477
MGNKIAREKDEVSHGIRQLKNANHVKQTTTTATTSLFFSNNSDHMTQDNQCSKCWVTHDVVIKGENMISEQRSSYADLPMDILSSIAGRLSVMDLLSFRSTCKDFHSVAANMICVSQTDNWLLYHETTNGFRREIRSSSSSNNNFYNKTKIRRRRRRRSCSGEYIFYDKRQDKTYSRNIPDLEGSYCLGSDHGWLLVFKDDLLFFLSPFTLAKITLPDLPNNDNIYGHVAAFSDVPTSPHCVISIFKRVPEHELIEVNVICKGQRVWTQHKVCTPCNNLWASFCTISGAIFDHKTQTFYYVDSEIQYYVLKVSSVKDDDDDDDDDEHQKWIPYLVDVNDDNKNVSDCNCRISLSSSNSVHVICRDKMMRDGSVRFFEDDHVDTSRIGFHENGRYLHLHSRAVDLTPPKTGIRMAINIQPRLILPSRMNGKKLG